MRCVNAEAKHNSTVAHDWQKIYGEQHAVYVRIKETGAFTINLILT